jgi:hydrogenase expression/formation protein HypC
MRVVDINGSLALAELGGVRREISLELLPEARVGDHVIVHAGFAISRLEREEASAIMELLRGGSPAPVS